MALVDEGPGGWPGAAEALAYLEQVTSEAMAEVTVGTLVLMERMVAMLEAPGAQAMLAVTGGQLEWAMPLGLPGGEVSRLLAGLFRACERPFRL